MSRRFRIAQSILSAEILPGGKADGKKNSDFDPRQLELGQETEREHTSDPALAREIARDHLTEDSRYYTHLREMERGYAK